jgi:hypothetical protein
MATPKKAKKGMPAPPIPQMFIDPSDGEVMDIQNRQEQWSEFILTDGATLRLRPAVVEIRKLRNQFAPNGDPIYIIKSTVVNDTKIPDNLKKKG